MGQCVESRIYARAESLHAPHLLDLEVAQVLWRVVRETTISAERADQAIQGLHFIFLSEIWRVRHNLSAYDAAYITLAEELGATLVTRDAHLASTPGIKAKIELF